MKREPTTIRRAARGRGASPAPARATLLGVLLLPALVGCDSLLEVEPSDEVLAEDLFRPENAGTLVSGVIADYECAHAAYVSWAATLGDEFLSGGTGDGVEARRDIREEAPSNWSTGDCGESILGLLDPISTARFSADTVLRSLETWTDAQVVERDRLLATAAAYSGFAHLFHAEGMCETAFDGGPRLGPEEVLERAEDRFTRALEAAEAADSQELLNFALVGRARTRLRMARRAGELVDPTALEAAAQDADRVAEGFRKVAEYSTAAPRTQNHVWASNGPAAPDDLETIGTPYREASFDGVPDPRIPLENTGREPRLGPGLTLWVQQKYPDASSPIEIATWEEAQLIVAEAELEGGNPQAAVEIVNELHRRVGLPDTFESSDPEEILDQIVYERRAELFLEGQLLGDAALYDLPFSPPVGARVALGGTYGEVRCFPLPDVETENNPNI